jgi:hypothetical protein
MRYAIDTDGTGRVGSTLLTTGAELRDCGTTFAYAAGLARRGVDADQPALTAALQDFLETHLTALELITSACEALAGNLTWAARSAHEAELAAAAQIGARGLATAGALAGSGARS